MRNWRAQAWTAGVLIAIGAGVLFACGGAGAPVAAPSSPSDSASPGPGAGPRKGHHGIPHGLEGKSDCASCHKVGGPRGMPEDHQGRDNASCTGCHQPREK